MNLPALTFQKEALSRFGELLEKEWLVTNGLGSYASSTVLGINTRKYHGLLVAALDPPGNRTVCVSKIDEDVFVNNDIYRLGSTDFRDVIYPEGYKLITKFSLGAFPTYVYDAGNVEAKKTIFMPKKKNAIIVDYKITNRNSDSIKLRLFPLLTCRYFHTVTYRLKNPHNFVIKNANTQFQVTFQRPQATVACHITEGEFKEKINWVNNIHYRDEMQRGEAAFEDCFQPGYFEIQVPPNAEKEIGVTFAVSHENQQSLEILNSVGLTIHEVNKLFEQEVNKRTELIDAFYGGHSEVPMSDWLNWILLAADSFVVENGDGKKAIIAGYHWFEPWGRDTFISLTGLMLTTGRFSEAKNILQTFIKYCKKGLIPNYISDKLGEPAYNTVDGTLWYVNAVFQYAKYSGDFNFVQEELWENMKEIIDFHEQGTFFDIRVDYDGLLIHGSRLTWMDAAVGTKEITPRAGKAVEIQALWYNTLRIMQVFANKFGENAFAKKYDSMAEKTSKSFNQKFWNQKKTCLFDVLEANSVDESLRPNQIFAVSLDFTMLNELKSAQVVELVHRELVTPYGLRTLSLTDPKFIGKCFGDRTSRDTAYHNGTIWPWLLGPFVSAYLKVNSYNPQSREYALRNFILPLLRDGIHQAGLGTLSEIYDCDSPNTPRGCISQAWSVAEPLRAYIEDVLLVKPNFSKEILGT